MRSRFAIVVHGGAGRWAARDADAALAGVRAAAEAGRRVLAGGGAALDAAVAAVVVLEDDPVFNAGTGSVLNLAGEAEMDACVMEGAALRAGAVGALKGVRNPVLVARKVMEETEHVLLAGEGALHFARAMGFPEHDPVTEDRRRDHRDKLAQLRESGTARALLALLERHPYSPAGTVGAATLDRSGTLAAATSTGGLSLKLPGRIGDTPIPGAGNYATEAAAASATGHGEIILRLLATRHACDLAAQGEPAQAAAERVLAALGRLGGGAGLIVVDAAGRIGAAHDTEFMPHGFFVAGDPEVTARMKAED